MTKTNTAGIIIIGDEILSGKVHDVNSYFLAQELRSLGVDVKRISVISDDVETIGREVVEFSNKYDYVFTSGGVGPTHDDVTMAGIANGFNVALIEHPEIKNILLSKYSKLINSAVMKMTMVPEGSEIDFSENLRFPVISFKNVFIFPGIPEYIKNKFHFIREKFRSSVFHLKKIYLKCYESDIAEHLNSAVENNKDVSFGSYPALGQPDYNVMITVEGKSESAFKEALDELLQKIPDECLVRVE